MEKAYRIELWVVAILMVNTAKNVFALPEYWLHGSQQSR
jgi:hypothetical protein